MLLCTVQDLDLSLGHFYTIGEAGLVSYRNSDEVKKYHFSTFTANYLKFLKAQPAFQGSIKVEES